MTLNERRAVITFQINKDKPITKTLSLGFTEFPDDVTTSKVTLRAGLTRGVSDFNFVRVDVEITDVTLSNPKARRICAAKLADEVLDATVSFTKKSVERLFGTKI